MRREENKKTSCFNNGSLRNLIKLENNEVYENKNTGRK